MVQTLYLFVGLALWHEINAFSPNGNRNEYLSHRSSLSALHLQKSHDRRTFLAQQFIIAPAIASLSSATILPNPALAVTLLMDKSSPDIPPFNPNTDSASEAKKRFQLAIHDVDNLLANYDTIAKDGAGDNVRLYLGTQGVKSNMWGITKVLKSLKEESEDIVEYTEALNEFEAYLFQAEGAAYQSMFVEHSSAKSTPESLLRTARGDVVNMRKFMGDMALQLSLEV